jgi:arylformamidase
MIIYKKYDQQQLDLQYNNRFHVPDFERYIQGWENISKQTGKKYRVIKDLSYGESSRECLDIFPSPDPGSKTLIFIHGGYWQRFDKSFFHLVSGAFADYGITIVLVNYPLAPVVSLDQIVSSSCKAMNWVYKNISQYNGDPEQVYIAGHSAGGHLAAMIMATEKIVTPQTFIKGFFVMSGLFNLIPIQLSNVNDGLQMDKEMAIRNSPSFKEPVKKCPLLIAVGAEDDDAALDRRRAAAAAR